MVSTGRINRPSLLEFTLRRPLERFTAELPGNAREKIGRQTLGPGVAVLGLHQFQGVAHQLSSEDAALTSSVFNFASNCSAIADMILSYRRDGRVARMTSQCDFPVGRIVHHHQTNQP